MSARCWIRVLLAALAAPCLALPASAEPDRATSAPVPAAVAPAPVPEPRPLPEPSVVPEPRLAPEPSPAPGPGRDRVPERPPPAGALADAVPMRGAEVLASLDRRDMGETWLSHHMDRVGISGKYGLTYTRHLDSGEKGVRLRFGGPVLRKAKGVGLSFELRF